MAFEEYPAGLRLHLRSINLSENLNDLLETLRRNSGGHFHAQRGDLVKTELLTDFTERGGNTQHDS